MNNRNMFPGNPVHNYPWHPGHGPPDWYRFGNQAMYINQGYFPHGPQDVPFHNRWVLIVTGQTNEPQRKKTYHVKCASSEGSDQPAHSRSLIRIFTCRILDTQGCKVSSC